jgi:hypothetical protein
MLNFLKGLGLLAIGLLFIALIAWLVFPSSQKAAESIAETNPAKKKTLGEIIVRDFLGIPKCGLLGGGCSDTFSGSSTGSTITTNQPRFSHPDIKVSIPTSGSLVKNEMTVEGVAKTSWFAQGIASGDVRNEKDEKVGAFTVRTQSTIKDNSFVTFTGTVLYTNPDTKTGYIVFNKANPTGDTSKNVSLWVPIRFQETSSAGNTFLTPPGATKECRKTGCSGQICSDVDMVTTCEYRQEYACYQAARCERQANGECGFTPTSELSTCLAQGTSGTQNGIQNPQ